MDRLKLDLEVLAGEQALGEIRLPGLASNLASMGRQNADLPELGGVAGRHSRSQIDRRRGYRGAPAAGPTASRRGRQRISLCLRRSAMGRRTAELPQSRPAPRSGSPQAGGGIWQLERDRIKETQGQVRLRHGERIPRGTAGEMGVIRGEIGRRKGHKPIRWLMKNAGSMVQRIKPIMLMSPISVAQYLPQGPCSSIFWSSTRPRRFARKTRLAASRAPGRSSLWATAAIAADLLLRPDG